MENRASVYPQTLFNASPYCHTGRQSSFLKMVKSPVPTCPSGSLNVFLFSPKSTSHTRLNEPARIGSPSLASAPARAWPTGLSLAEQPVLPPRQLPDFFFPSLCTRGAKYQAQRPPAAEPGWICGRTAQGGLKPSPSCFPEISLLSVI